MLSTYRREGRSGEDTLELLTRRMKWGIRKKLILLLMVATILPFGTGIIITYYYTIDSIKERSVTTNYDFIKKGEEELSVYLEDIAQMSSVLYRYTPFMNVLVNGIEDDSIVNEEEVRRLLAYLFNTRTEIEQMHLYIDNGADAYTNYHSKISGRVKYENIYEHPYYAQFKTNKKDYSLIEAPHEIYSYNNISEIPNSEKNNVLSFHNIIRNIPSEDFLGFLSIDINLSRIESIAERLYTAGEEDLYIVDDKKKIIYSSKKEEIGEGMTKAWYENMLDVRNKHSYEWEDKEFSGVIVFQKFSVQENDWYIAKRIPYAILYQTARETVVMNSLIGVIALAIVLLVTSLVSVKVTAPIKVLIANMKKVESGKLEADFDSLGNDEIGMLGKHFKSMIEKINLLIDKEYKLEIENKASQLRVLRSQINPHFLYNSLQSIGTLALKSKAKNVYSLLTSLSNIMRYSMNMQEDIVPFSMEIKHVQAYLSLQKQRFDERFEFHIHVSPGIGNTHVPKMILQPIVENCFKHGFADQDKLATITIQATLLNDYIVLSVSDNGKGVSMEELQEIRQKLYKRGNIGEPGERESIGLKNIYERIQIYYDNQAEMIISGKEDQGFMAEIYIPKILNGVQEK